MAKRRFNDGIFRGLHKQVDEGYEDFLTGNMTNPYKATTMKGKEWQRGFNRAYFDNLKAIS